MTRINRIACLGLALILFSWALRLGIVRDTIDIDGWRSSLAFALTFMLIYLSAWVFDEYIKMTKEDLQ